VEVILDTAKQHMDAGVLPDGKGHIGIAIYLYKEAIKLDPVDKPELYTSCGIAFKSLGKYDDAIPILRIALELDPNDPTASSHSGDCYRLTGDPESAERDYNEALSIFKRTTDREVNDYRSAMRAVIGLKKLGIRDVDASVLLDVQGDIEIVIDLYKEAIKLDSQEPALYTNLGLAFKSLEKYDDAIAYLRIGLELDPRDPMASSHSGDCHRLTGNPESAERDYNEALSIFKDLSSLKTTAANMGVNDYLSGMRAVEGLKKLGKTTSEKIEEKALQLNILTQDQINSFYKHAK